MLHDLGALARRACCKGSRRASKRPPDAFPLNERPGLVGQQTSRSAAGFKRCKALLGRTMNRYMRGAGCAVRIRSLVVGSGGGAGSCPVLIQKSGTSFQNGLAPVHNGYRENRSARSIIAQRSPGLSITCLTLRIPRPCILSPPPSDRSATKGNHRLTEPRTPVWVRRTEAPKTTTQGAARKTV